MAEGTQRAGEIAEKSGLSFQELAAIVGTTSEVTREGGDKIGTTLKTVLARASRSTDPDTTLEERSEAAKALSRIGIELYDDNGVYQDFSVTLDELSAKWDQLTDAERELINLSR